MYVCYLEIKKPRGRKWEHVFTFTDYSVTSALNRVELIDFETVMFRNNNFDYRLTVVDNHRVEYIFKNGFVKEIKNDFE